MNWVRAGAILAAVGVHAVALAALMTFGARDDSLNRRRAGTI